MAGDMFMEAGGQPQMASLGKLYISFEMGFPIGLELTGDIRLDHLVNEPLGSIYPCLPAAGVTRMDHHTQYLYVSSGGGTQVFMIVRQALDWLSHPPCPLALDTVLKEYIPE